MTAQQHKHIAQSEQVAAGSSQHGIAQMAESPAFPAAATMEEKQTK